VYSLDAIHLQYTERPTNMPVEIERKFLVCGEEWRREATGQRYCQGYLARADGVTVRVRRAGRQAFLTIKGPAHGLARPEFEYPVPVDEAEAMFKLCHRPLIEKTRYEIPYRDSIQRSRLAGG
jgi:adenylate cyclase